MQQSTMSCSCCPEASWPSLDTGYTATGTQEKRNGYDLYTVGSGTKAIVVIPDVFGIDSGRTKAICDQLADRGYLVVLPDLFKGQPLTMDEMHAGKFGEWAARFPFETVLRPILVDDIIPWLKQEKGVTKVGLAGFCFGSWVVFHVSAIAGAVDCGVNFHPSLRLEEMCWQGSTDGLAQNVTCPQLLLSAGNDPESVREGGSVIAILQEKPFGKDCAVKDFPDMAHGWVNRGDLSDANCYRDIGLAIQIAIAFFDKHL